MLDLKLHGHQNELRCEETQSEQCGIEEHPRVEIDRVPFLQSAEMNHGDEHDDQSSDAEDSQHQVNYPYAFLRPCWDQHD